MQGQGSRVAVFLELKNFSRRKFSVTGTGRTAFGALVNSLERNVRRLLRRPPGARPAPDAGLHASLRRAFGTQSETHALDLAIDEALCGYAPKRRKVLMQALRGSGRVCVRGRTYYRAKKEIIERLVEIVGDRLSDTKPHAKLASEAVPIALPMVDRLVPERIVPDRYYGPDRGRALSAAALAAEMAGEQERADSLIFEASENVRNQYDRIDIASAFEVSQNAFFISRCRGDLHGMRDAVRAGARFYSRLSAPARLKYSLDCSEVFLYEGRLQDACAELDFALLDSSSRAGTLLKSIVLLRKAQIALARHDLQGAEDAGRSAMIVARGHADIRVYATEVLGRSSLQTKNAWSSDGLEECQSAFHSLCVRTVLARHQLQRGKTDAACETARSSYDQAMQLHYWNLASRSASTLASVVSCHEAQTWLMRALRLYLMSKRQNAFIGDDLFEVGSCSSHVTRTFLLSSDAATLLSNVYLTRFPNSAFEADANSILSGIASFMLRGSVRAEKSVPVPSVLLSSAANLCTQSTGLQEIERAVRRLGHLICALSILFPFDQRADFDAASRRQTHRTVRTLRRLLARRHWAVLRSACS